jgi:hypothetical protein
MINQNDNLQKSVKANKKVVKPQTNDSKNKNGIIK